MRSIARRGGGCASTAAAATSSPWYRACAHVHLHLRARGSSLAPAATWLERSRFAVPRLFSSVAAAAAAPSTAAPSTAASSTSTGAVQAATSSASASSTSTFRVAVVGSGPSAMYTCKYLLKERLPVGVDLHIDVYERLPVPFGLARFGVAPDHPEVRSVQNDFQAHVLSDARVRLLTSVEVGRDVSVSDLRSRYHAVVLAYGAQSERMLRLPGSHLTGVHPSRHFVNWYNGHPEHVDDAFALDAEHVVIVGQGNVALDCARILLAPREHLSKSEIAPHALAALTTTTTTLPTPPPPRTRHVYLLGRRGPVQAAFTTAEFRELTSLPGIDRVVIRERDMVDGVNEASRVELGARVKKRKFELVQQMFERCRGASDGGGGGSSDGSNGSGTPGERVLHVHFLSAPVEYVADRARPTHVGGVRVERTRLVGEAERQVAVGTGEFEVVPAGLVIESIGYRSVAIEPSVPFDDQRAVVPSVAGRVVEGVQRGGSQLVPGLYVAGWLKRGATGIIGSNIGDARETVTSIVQDVPKLIAERAPVRA